MKVHTKVKLETPKQAMAPSRSLPRSASELGDPPSPFSSNPAHHPVSVPTTPGLSSCSSFGRMLSPPNDKQCGGGNNKPKQPTPAAAAAAYYASLWSPRRLMQRAARAFRRSRSRGHVRTVKDLAEERASVLAANSSSKVADEAAAVLPPAGPEISSGARDQQQQCHDDYHHEVVPEKIIHEDAPPVVVAEEKETAAAGFTEVEVETPKKGEAAAAPVPEAIVAAGAGAEDDVVADKFVTVVKEAIKKHEAAAADKQEEKKEAMRRFQGSRVKTAMEARPESEQPRRREVVRSNDVIEEARTKLLEKRHSRVKALVGAFETVMEDTKKDAVAVAAGGKPQHHYRRSA